MAVSMMSVGMVRRTRQDKFRLDSQRSPRRSELASIASEIGDDLSKAHLVSDNNPILVRILLELAFETFRTLTRNAFPCNPTSNLRLQISVGSRYVRQMVWGKRL